ncbi:MAG TPA: SusE domain-containing protein [Puia sp.]|nr:SusE domain-containing protein [Puia sp.]
MKNSVHYIFSIAAGLVLLASCKKDEAKVYFEGGTAPVLTSSATDSISLPVNDTTATAATFTWTNPNYMFSDGPSSLNVHYYLQFDTTSAFSSANMQTVGINSSLSVTYTVAQLNAILANGLLLSTGNPHTVYIRVQSFIQPFTSTSQPEGTLSSSPLNFMVTPYAPPPAVTPPANDSLYIVGSAVPDNWANPIPSADLASETFTMVSPTEYKLTTTLTGGGEYKLISVNGSWTNQWSVATADTYPNGGPFVSNGNNSIAPAATGTYLIDVNFQTGKFTVTAQ